MDYHYFSRKIVCMYCMGRFYRSTKRLTGVVQIKPSLTFEEYPVLSHLLKGPQDKQT